MVPRKLVETFFGRFWILLAPVIAMPMAFLLLQDSVPAYRSSAVVWVGSSPAGNQVFGHYNPWLSPAANQANSINDLLATEAFRLQVLRGAGLVAPETPEPVVPAGLKIYSYAHGANLLTIVGEAPDAVSAQSLVDSAIKQFRARGTQEAEQNAGLSAEYYDQQLKVAEAEFTARKKAVDDYVRANPAAAIPGSAYNVGLDYQSLITRAEDQGLIVLTLQNSLQAVQRSLASAPQSQEAAFEVQDEPKVPAGPVPVSYMSRLGLPVAALLLGALISATYLYVVYRTDHTIQSAEDLEGLDVRVLGRVPQIEFDHGLGKVRGLGWIARSRNRDYARRTASSISSDRWAERGA